MPAAAAPATVLGRGHERIRAVVEVEQRPLRAFEQDARARRATRGRRAATCRRRTAAAAARSPRSAPPAPPSSSGSDAVDALEPDVLLGERDLDLLAQDLRVEQVLHADPEPRRLVGVRRARCRAWSCRSAACRAAARCAWSIATCHGMIRCASPETRTQRGRDPARLELVQLRRANTSGSTTQPAPMTHSLPCRIPDGIVADLERLAVDDDRVPGVRPALVAADEVGVLGRAGRRSCPCPRRPTGRPRSQSAGTRAGVVPYLAATRAVSSARRARPHRPG